MKKLIKSEWKYFLVSVVSFAIFLFVWELVTNILGIMRPYQLPSPERVVAAFTRKLTSTAPTGSVLSAHVLASLQVTLYGFTAAAIIGIPLGIAMAWYRKVDLLISPLFDLLRPIPPIGWVPIMMLLFGIGLESKAAVIFIAAIIPNILNSYSGVRQTNPVHLWVGQTFGASKTQMLFSIAIPTALPMIFTGLRVSLGIAWMTLVAAELVAASRGLGFMLQIARSIGRADIIVMGMFVIAAIGTILTSLLYALEKKFTKGYRVK